MPGVFEMKNGITGHKVAADRAKMLVYSAKHTACFDDNTRFTFQ
jgi:hypothetical protein